jgi:hypothetical protein
MKRDGEFRDQNGVAKSFAARMLLQNLCLCQSIKQRRSSGKD